MLRLLALALAAVPALAITPPAPPAPPPAAAETPDPAAQVLDTATDQNQRMTVPVNIGANGPYPFIVDTGSERTVIARELAAALRLDTAGRARVHSMTEVSDILTYMIPRIEVGGRSTADVQAPGLERRNLGAMGIIGSDLLQAKRVSFDFARQQMTVVPSRKRQEDWGDDVIVVKARSRFGQLVLMDASVEGQKVWVIVDTGAQVTVGNSALRHRLEQKHLLEGTQPLELLSVTGGRTQADWTHVKVIKLGDMKVTNMPIAFADVHPFQKLQLMDKPALLLGMDVLRLFDRVSVDFANREVRLQAPGHSDLPRAMRLASLEGSYRPGS